MQGSFKRHQKLYNDPKGKVFRYTKNNQMLEMHWCIVKTNNTIMDMYTLVNLNVSLPPMMMVLIMKHYLGSPIKNKKIVIWRVSTWRVCKGFQKWIHARYFFTQYRLSILTQPCSFIHFNRFLNLVEIKLIHTKLFPLLTHTIFVDHSSFKFKCYKQNIITYFLQ